MSSTNNHEKRNGSNYPQQNKRIGVYGGTFNPIHIAHLIAAEAVYEALNLDEVWFMPARIPPHKQDQRLAASEHRLRMLQLALEPYQEFKVCTYELEQSTISYTFDTMKALVQKYADHQFNFIIGADMVAYLSKWYRYEELLAMVPFVAVQRPQHPIASELPWLRHIHMVNMPQIDISSTEIRQRCKNNRSIRFLVPNGVDTYIKEHQLYVE